MSWGSRGGARASKSKSCQFMLQCLIIGHQAGKKTLAALSTSGLCQVSVTYFLEMSQNTTKAYLEENLAPAMMQIGHSIVFPWLMVEKFSWISQKCQVFLQKSSRLHMWQVAYTGGTDRWKSSVPELRIWHGQEVSLFIHQVGAFQVGRLQGRVNRKCHKPAT